MAKNSRMLVGKYVSEKLKVGARKARACNIARWFVLNYHALEGTYVPYAKIRSEIPNHVKNTNLNPLGDKRAHGDAIRLIDLSSIKIKNEPYIDMSLINLKRCVSFSLGSAGTGAIYIKKVNINGGIDVDDDKDLVLIKELNKVCRKTIVFNDLSIGAKAFVHNLVKNYPIKIKNGSSLSDSQREWASDLIDQNR